MSDHDVVQLDDAQFKRHFENLLNPHIQRARACDEDDLENDPYMCWPIRLPLSGWIL